MSYFQELSVSALSQLTGTRLIRQENPNSNMEYDKVNNVAAIITRDCLMLKPKLGLN